MRLNLLPYLSAFLTFIYFFLIDNSIFYTSLGLAFSIFILFDFLNKIGKVLPIKELIVLIAAMQWVVGAKISYAIGKVHYKYYMYVEEEVYMSYVVPGVILFYLGLNIFRNQLVLNHIPQSIDSNRNAVLRSTKIILIIGLVAFLLPKAILIPGLSFVFYLLSLLIYVGVAHLMYLFYNRKHYIFLIALLFMFVLSLQSGSFHNLIIVVSFLSFFLFYSNTTFIKKMILIIVGFIGIYCIQLVKGEYRAIIWGAKGDVSVFNAFYSVLEKEFFPQATYNSIELNPMEEEEEQTEVNTRLNQGWIISKIMENIPKNQPFLRGETVTEAFESSILPRFLFPDKKGADQALVNFMKISGIRLNKGTSMGLSIIGEFYANYGIAGGWIAMFIYGLFIALVIKFIISTLGGNSPLILLWFLLFFFQVIKAETELMKVINHLFKSIMFFIALRIGLKAIGIDLIPQESTN